MTFLSVMEVVQFIVACIGFTFAVYRLFIVVELALEVVDTPPEDPQRLIASIIVRGHMNRVAAQALLVLAGIVSLLLPNHDDADYISMEQGALIRVILMGLTILLAVDAALESKQRRNYDQKIKKFLAENSKHDVAILVNGKTAARGEMAVEQSIAEAVDVPKEVKP